LGKEAEAGDAREGDWAVLVWEEPLVVERVLDLDLGLEREGVADAFDFNLDLDDEDDEEDFCLRVDTDVLGS
jgi:hypothetical protein